MVERREVQGAGECHRPRGSGLRLQLKETATQRQQNPARVSNRPAIRNGSVSAGYCLTQRDWICGGPAVNPSAACSSSREYTMLIHRLPLDAALSTLRSTLAGLSQADAAARHLEFGPNRIERLSKSHNPAFPGAVHPSLRRPPVAGGGAGLGCRPADARPGHGDARGRHRRRDCRQRSLLVLAGAPGRGDDGRAPAAAATSGQNAA